MLAVVFREAGRAGAGLAGALVSGAGPRRVLGLRREAEGPAPQRTMTIVHSCPRLRRVSPRHQCAAWRGHLVNPRGSPFLTRHESGTTLGWHLVST